MGRPMFGLDPNGNVWFMKRNNSEIVKIMRDPNVQESLQAQSFEIIAGSPEALGKRMREDAITNAKVVADAKIKAE